MIKKIIVIEIMNILLLTGFAASSSLVYDVTSEINITENTILQIPFGDNILSIIQQIDKEMVLGYLEDIVSFGPRFTGTESCEQAADYIYNEFESMGMSVRYHNASDDKWNVINVEATLPGVNVNSNKIYIICAHYDTDYMSQGADDDGSGVAAVLASAKVMSQYSFNNTIRFITFGGEEQFMLGSTRYAKDAKENGDNIIAVLNADMIGSVTWKWWDKETKYIDIWYNDKSAWIANFTYNVSTRFYDHIKIKVNKAGYKGLSDHASFWNEGFDAIQYKHGGEKPYPDIIEYVNILYNTKVIKLITASLAALANDINIPKGDIDESITTNIEPISPSTSIEKIYETFLYNTINLSPC